MRKIIVVTTINPVTEAIKKMDGLEGWELIVVGDKKTPKDFKLKNGYFMTCKEQEKKYPKLSKILGWNSVDRRNLGFLEAYKRGADVVAMMDDDNIPKENFGQDIYVDTPVLFDCYKTASHCFDPLFVADKRWAQFWHRGYPIELVYHRKIQSEKIDTLIPLVQANLWDDDPDIDAFARLSFRPIVDYSETSYFFSETISPFNMQNTIVSRKALKYLPSIPFTGRMCDIWGAYYLQSVFPKCVLYGPSTVIHTQVRTIESMIKDIKEEIVGYDYTLALVKDLKKNGPEALFKYIPIKAKEFIKAYQKEFD